jgi:peptidylprolyl isomerase
MKFKFVFIFICLSVFYNCNKEKPKTILQQPDVIKKKVVVIPEKTIPKINKDSLNRKNVVSFFTEYGKQNLETKVRFKTRLGDIIIKLYNDTPIHRANFIFLTKIGYFDTTCFHRVVPDFIAQGGNSESHKTAKIRNKYRNYLLPSEFRKNHRHKRGIIAAAREWENNPKKNSTPFEFYFVQNRKGEHHLNGEHTVFGEVIKGMLVIDKIIMEKADTDEWPFIDVEIQAEVIK